MNLRLMIAAGLALVLAMSVMAPGAQARPYLMLAADNQGFKALDLGDIHADGIDTAQATLITAPLAGAPYGDRRAALMKQRVEFDCQAERWRVISVTYSDAKDAALANGEADGGWRPTADDSALAVSKDAACLRRYRQTMVSRDLNLGDIVANYHRAWSQAASEPMTEKQLLQRRFDAGH
jgi:hypothetical protein